MSTKTIIAWIGGVAQEVEVVETDYVPTMPTIEDRITNLEKQQPTTVSVTLLASNWTESTDENGDIIPKSWCQVVLQGSEYITECSKVDLQPSVTQLAIFHEKDLSFVAENDGGVITVFCVGQKPTNDYTIQSTVMEVVCDG